LQKRSKVRRVATKGYNGKNQYVKKYKLQFSDDGVNFQYYKEQGQTTDKVTDCRYFICWPLGFDRDKTVVKQEDSLAGQG